MAVYFAAADDLNLVKIGQATLPTKRLMSLAGMSPVPLRLAAIDEDGDRLTEAELHYRFRALRKRGEWFLMAPDLMEVIRETAKAGSVPGGWYAPPESLRRYQNAPAAATLRELQQRLGVTMQELAEEFLPTTYFSWTQHSFGIPASALPRLHAHLVRRRPGLHYLDLFASAADAGPDAPSTQAAA